MNFERCPYSVTFPYKERTNEYAQAGIDAHKEVESYLTGNTPDVPLSLAGGFDWVGLRALSPTVEEPWGFDRDWQPCAYRVAWLKVKPDIYIETDITVRLIDIKNGKREHNEVKHVQQLQLYLCSAQAKFPGRKTYLGEDWYLPLGKSFPTKIYTENHLLAMRHRWHQRGAAMTDAKDYPPRPSRSNCRFCEQREDCQFAFED